jgi:peptidyl-prolyl cis-trans isomerase C
MNRILTCALIVLASAMLMFACGEKNPAPAADESAAPTAEEAAPAAATPPSAPETAAAAAVPAVAAAGARVEGPVAKVNGVDIAAAEFYAELEKITARGADIPRERLLRIQQNILKRLIEKELVRQAVEKKGIQVTDADLEGDYAEYKKRFQTEEQFQNYLKHGRVTEDSIKTRLREKAALEKLIESQGDMVISDADAQEFYTKNERFYLEKSGMRASHILVKVAENASQEQTDTAQTKIKAVQKMLADGQEFAEVAKTQSEGPSAPKGGDLGFFGKGQMVKAFEDAAFAMKPGAVSDVVRTRFGLHIIKLEEKREERKKPFDEVKDQIVQSLKNKKFFQQRRDLLQGLQTDAKVEKFIEEAPPVQRPAAQGGGPAAAAPDRPIAPRPGQPATPIKVRPVKAGPPPPAPSE